MTMKQHKMRMTMLMSTSMPMTMDDDGPLNVRMMFVSYCFCFFVIMVYSKFRPLISSISVAFNFHLIRIENMLYPLVDPQATGLFRSIEKHQKTKKSS